MSRKHLQYLGTYGTASTSGLCNGLSRAAVTLISSESPLSLCSSAPAAKKNDKKNGIKVSNLIFPLKMHASLIMLQLDYTMNNDILIR
jgi:hypothetical protein